MVRVKGSSGRMISIEIRGVEEVLRQLRATNNNIQVGVDFGVIKAGTFIEEEVKESIAGNRPNISVKSVDTGLFGNSVKFKRTRHAEGVVAPERKTYPGTKTNTQDVALILEKGTSRLQPRKHFKNTEMVNKGKIKKVIEKEINETIRKRHVVNVISKGKVFKGLN